MKQLRITHKRLAAIGVFGAAFEAFGGKESIIRHRARLLSIAEENSVVRNFHGHSQLIAFNETYKRFSTDFGVHSLLPSENTIIALAGAYYHKGNATVCYKICRALVGIFYKDQAGILGALDDVHRMQIKASSFDFNDPEVSSTPVPFSGISYFTEFSACIPPFEETPEEFIDIETSATGLRYIQFCSSFGAPYLLDLVLLRGLGAQEENFLQKLIHNTKQK